MNIQVDKTILIDNLKTIKNYFGRTNKFYEIVGIDYTTIYYWTSGRRTPRLSTLKKICDYLDISALDLLTKKLKLKTIAYVEESKEND